MLVNIQTQMYIPLLFCTCSNFLCLRLFHSLKHLITQIKNNIMYSFMDLEAEVVGLAQDGINNVRSRT